MDAWRKKPRFHVVAMRRGEWPTPWIWEIFSGRRPLNTRIWGGYFKSEAAAKAEGQQELVRFLKWADGLSYGDQGRLWRIGPPVIRAKEGPGAMTGAKLGIGTRRASSDMIWYFVHCKRCGYKGGSLTRLNWSGDIDAAYAPVSEIKPSQGGAWNTW
jgi:hypothetical protein